MEKSRYGVHKEWCKYGTKEVCKYVTDKEDVKVRPLEGVQGLEQF